jgi:hypothetical protein
MVIKLMTTWTPSWTPEEKEFIDWMERFGGETLTNQQRHYSILQARMIRHMDERNGGGRGGIRGVLTLCLKMTVSQIYQTKRRRNAFTQSSEPTLSRGCWIVRCGQGREHRYNERRKTK